MDVDFAGETLMPDLQRKLNIKEIIETKKEPVLRRQLLDAANQGLLERSLIADRHLIDLGNVSAWPTRILRGTSGITAEDAAHKILSFCGESGTKAAGDLFSILTVDDDSAVARFVGAVQQKFLAAGHGIEALQAGLAFAVDRQWLTPGRRYGTYGEVESYVLTQAGAAQAS